MDNLNRVVVSLAGIFGMVLTMTGCAHPNHARGSIAVRHGEQEADVCLGDKEVKSGDKVALFKNDCKANKGARGENGTFRCTKLKIGEGQVLQVLDEHYSTIRVNPGVPLSEGVIVEKY